MQGDLTDAVMRAVMTADGLVRIYGTWQGQPDPDSFTGMLKGLDRYIRASNGLVERRAEFWGHYPMPPVPIGDVAGASYHEQGRSLAFRVFWGIFSAADPTVFGSDRELDFDAVLAKWPAVQKYLREEAPSFHAQALIALIQDEVVKAGVAFPPDPQEDNRRKASVNALVLDLLQRRPEAHGWSARKIAYAIDRGKTAVAACPAYKELDTAREMVRLEREGKAQEEHQSRSDRRRRKKPVRPDE